MCCSRVVTVRVRVKSEDEECDESKLNITRQLLTGLHTSHIHTYIELACTRLLIHVS